jgi:hypothetical protein
MDERTIIDRLTDAVTQFRDPFPSKILGDIETKSDRPAFGQTGWYNSFDTSLQFGWRSSRINYANELGRLDNSSLVMAVVNWTGINLAEALPIVQKPDKKGGLEVDHNHPAANLIRRPNPFHIWADYCLAGAFSWWMGNWYMLKVREKMTGNILELWYLPHFLVEPRWPYDGKSPDVPLSEVEGDPHQSFISHYQYTQPGKTPILIPKSEIVHIKRGVNLDNPRKGIGVWDGVLQDLYGHDAVNRFSAAILGNMGMAQVILSPKDKDVTVSPEQARQIKEQYIINTTGENAGRPLVNPVGIDVTKTSWSPKELDLSELDKAPQAAIAGATGIPAIVLQFVVGLEHGHYGAAYEQARQQGYENVIIPIQNHISEDLTWQVLPEIDDTEGARLTFDITKVRVLQEDRDALYKRESEALRTGAITINQFLTSVGKDTIPEGDVYLIPAMSSPMTIERIKAVAEGTQAPPVPSPDTAALAKFADVDRMFERLESEMQEFARNAKR